MAELVHLRLEHGLAELEEMERVGLFSRGEVRKLIKKRKMFEYRLRRRMKKKEDFLKFIEFETILLRLITKRRERLLCDSKKKEIDNSIAKKVNRLFKAVISRYPEDQNLWLRQIEYLKRMKWHDSINALYTKLLQVHSKTPKLWAMAARWEMEDNNSFDNARKIFQRGVLMNPKSDLIWIEYFRMELMYIDVTKRRCEVMNLQNIKDDSEENDAVLKGVIVNVVYDKATEEIPDVEFAVSFIQLCLEFDFASKNIDYILDDIQKRFPDKEETLDVLSKRPLLNIAKKIEKGKKKGIKKKAVLKKMYEEIYLKYDEAIQILPTEKMWTLYLDFLLNLLQSAKENKKNKLQANVIAKMECAAEANCLSFAYYTQWIELLFEKGAEDDALAICLSAAHKWNNVSLWIKCLTLHIQCRKSSKKIYALFVEALNSLKDVDSVPVWKLGVDWLSISDPEKLIEFFEKGINKKKEVSIPLKEMYLEATAIRGGTQAARDLYKKFKKMGPLSQPLIKKMVLIEKGQLKPSAENLRKYFEDGVKEFGSSDIDIWLEYMHFEVEHDGGNPMLYGILYWRAMKNLQPDLVREFETRITEYCTGCGLDTNWDLVS